MFLLTREFPDLIRKCSWALFVWQFNQVTVWNWAHLLARISENETCTPLLSFLQNCILNFVLHFNATGISEQTELLNLKDEIAKLKLAVGESITYTPMSTKQEVYSDSPKAMFAFPFKTQTIFLPHFKKKRPNQQTLALVWVSKNKVHKHCLEMVMLWSILHAAGFGVKVPWSHNISNLESFALQFTSNRMQFNLKRLGNPCMS